MKYRICCRDRNTLEVQRGPWMIEEPLAMTLALGRFVLPQFEHFVETDEPVATDIPALVAEIMEDGHGQ